MLSCEGDYCASDKVFLSCRKVNVILSSDTAADRRKTGALRELWSRLINLHWRMASKQINKHTKDKTERRGKSWGKMDRHTTQLKGRHVWLLRAAHAGTAAATGCLLIYLSLLGLRGRGLLQINATFSFWSGPRVATFTVPLSATQTVHSHI